jgi:hypothetical protein
MKLTKKQTIHRAIWVGVYATFMNMVTVFVAIKLPDHTGFVLAVGWSFIVLTMVVFAVIAKRRMNEKV